MHCDGGSFRPRVHGHTDKITHLHRHPSAWSDYAGNRIASCKDSGSLSPSNPKAETTRDLSPGLTWKTIVLVHDWTKPPLLSQ